MEKELEELQESREEIKRIFNLVEETARSNPDLYIMPKSVHTEIMKKLGHMDDRIRLQTASLKVHIADKVELRRIIKASGKELRK